MQSFWHYLRAALLYSIHRLLLAYFVLFQYGIRVIKQSTFYLSFHGRNAFAVLKKRPRHLLIKPDNADNFSHASATKFISDCIRMSNEYNIEYVTIVANPIVTKALLACPTVSVFEDHQVLRNENISCLQVNVLTRDQKNLFLAKMKELSKLDPDFRFNNDNLLSSITPFPQVDLIVTNFPRLSYTGCLPCQIGFAETWYIH